MERFVEKIRVKPILKVAVYSLLFLLFIGNLITISYGVENLRVIRVFSDDEWLTVNNTLTNLRYNDLDPRGLYHYGYFYHTLGFFMVKTLNYFGFKVDAMIVALVLRLISLISYALAGFLIYKIFKRFFKCEEEFGLILVLFFLSIPRFAYWSRHVHPDTLQVFLILLAALVVFSKHRAANFLLGAAITGVAFGTKYSGIFILPFLFIPYFLYSIHRQPKDKKTWIKIISIGILGILIFLMMWLITNPYVIKNIDELKNDYAWVRGYVDRGHGRMESTNPFLWFDLLWKQLGLLGSVIVIGGTIMALASMVITVRKDGLKKFISDPVNRNLITAILYTVVIFVYLMIEVNMRRPRYIFHLLPFILIIALYGFQKISRLFKHPLVKQLIVIILLISVSFLTLETISLPAKATRKYDNDYLKAGNFLAENMSPRVKILADPYCYVPPKFPLVRIEWALDETPVRDFRPDIIILNAYVSGRRSWKKKGTTFKDLDFRRGRSDNWNHYYQFHKKLFSPDSGWKIIYETDNIVILKKKRREGTW